MSDLVPDGAMLIADVHIVRYLSADDRDIVVAEAFDGSGQSLALVESLGMIRLTEDTLIRESMGEIPEGTPDG